MQIGQLAAAADTTPRTVRHYHRLGLLDEPHRRSNGYREYTMSDVVRLMRIRWLADSGVPLGSVAAILSQDASDEDTDDTITDLHALIDVVHAEHAKLARRLVKLTSMLADVENGRPISALPSDLEGVLATAIATAPTPAVRAALERERDLLEVLAISGNVPDEFLSSYAASIADDKQRSRYFAFLAEWSNLAGRTPDSADTEIELLSRKLIAQFEDAGTFTDMESDSAQWGDAGMPVSLDDVIPDPAQREVVLRVQRELLTLTGSTEVAE
ncbi:MerR family transcriptional regulator [Rhodococcus sp. IEGM 1379]|uniref:helix-turn-helix domain-containing protein n=1 Tax=Rhodococcus sp. IEGM 1379 TaxID=3047086 RepID=UPI0024B75268|nr:MerR family transcriptional regulator [Rhodococcus sp. IEGM 1379]MDI9918635.1 MerR family transcriptional regulator [Rhodococcus sp. IEGM 1379]